VGEIISRFEKKGFLLKGLKLFSCPKDLAEVSLLILLLSVLMRRKKKYFV